MISYGRQTVERDDILAVVDVLRSDWMTQGPSVMHFEKALAQYCKVKYAVAVSSGTAALHLAVLAAGVKCGDEVITTPISFAATSNAILYAQATPRFADVVPQTINIDPSKIKELITKKTKGIIPVHFSGLPAQMKEISGIARKNGLFVIEDGCHALGAKYREGKEWAKVGSCRHSDMCIFSFHPVKHITTGEGGAITTNDEKLYRKLLALRSHGIYRDEKTAEIGPWYYEMRDLGFNYRITDFQCALGVTQLKKLDRFIKRRREIVSQYQEAFKDHEFFTVPQEPDGYSSAWHLFTICLRERYQKSRKDVFMKLRESGLGVQVHYIPIYWQPYYEGLGYPRGLCPAAESFYRGEISLPVYPLLKDAQVNSVIKKINKALKDL